MNPALRQKFADAWAQVREAITRGLETDADTRAKCEEEKQLIASELGAAVMAVERELSRLRDGIMRREKRLQDEIETLKQTIEKMTEAHMATRYRPTGLRDQYGLNLLFEPYAMGFSATDQKHLFYVAEAIGRQVAREIASCRFVRKTEYEPQERPRPETRPWTPGCMPPTDMPRPWRD